MNNNRRRPDIFSTILQQVLKDPKPEASTHTDESKEQSQSENSEESPPTNAKQFQGSSSQDNDNSFGLNLNAGSIVATMLRMVGFDASKLGALAINALIMIASAIGNTILNNTRPPLGNTKSTEQKQEDSDENGPEQRHSPTDQQPRRLKDGSPLDWFLQNPSNDMKNLLNDALYSNLTDKITEMIESRESRQGQGSCLKMLVCKSSPFIWGMQKSLKQRINGEDDGAEKRNDENSSNEKKSKKLFNEESFYTHFPTLEEYREHGEKCEKLYLKECNVTNIEGP